MLRDRKLTAVTVIAVALALLVLAVGYGLSSGESVASAAYTAAFTEESVMQVALTVDETEWENLLENAMDEEFIAVELSIDGVSYGVVGLRAKGNTSLSQVAASDSDRYSFKLDFSKYVEGNSFEGLNDMALNNMISDPSYLKEYLSYQLFEQMGVETPLCRFAWITVNGEDWGLYLAVEQIKEDFLERNYGVDYGNLYKPDTMDIGGGMDFSGMPEMDFSDLPEMEGKFPSPQGGFPGQAAEGEQLPDGTAAGAERPEENGTARDQNSFGGAAPAEEGGAPPDGGTEMQFPGEREKLPVPSESTGSETSQSSESGAQTRPEDGGAASRSGADGTGADGARPDIGQMPDFGGGFGGFSGGGGTSLVYTDDELDSYSGIFDNTETEQTTTADQERLVEILRQLDAGENLESCVDVEEVLRYFVVNTFLVNLDSYASSLKHNYYLYEEDGMISILPWDFNLSFGTFQPGDSSDIINFPIDTPVTDSMENSPLIAKLLEVPEYLERYHELYQELLEKTVDNGWYEAEIARVTQLISPYVEKDPTAFYSVEEYETAVEQLKLYFVDRAKSIRAQLAGEQPADEYGTMETSVDISALGSMGMGGGGGPQMPTEETAQEGKLPEEAAQGGEFPEAMAAMGRPENFGGRSQPGDIGTTGFQTELLISGVCMLLMIGGIVTVLCFRRRKYRSK